MADVPGGSELSEMSQGSDHGYDSSHKVRMPDFDDTRVSPLLGFKSELTLKLTPLS